MAARPSAYHEVVAETVQSVYCPSLLERGIPVLRAASACTHRPIWPRTHRCRPWALPGGPSYRRWSAHSTPQFLALNAAFHDMLHPHLHAERGPVLRRTAPPCLKQSRPNHRQGQLLAVVLDRGIISTHLMVIVKMWVWPPLEVGKGPSRSTCR